MANAIWCVDGTRIEVVCSGGDVFAVGVQHNDPAVKPLATYSDGGWCSKGYLVFFGVE